MDPKKFKHVNRVFTKPEGMTDEECGDLPVFQDNEQIISCWKVSEEEARHIMETRQVWLSIFGQGMPPVLPMAFSPFLEDKEESLDKKYDAIITRGAQEVDFFKHLNKMVEECGELIQAIAKRMAAGDTLHGIQLNYAICSELQDVKIIMQILEKLLDGGNLRSEYIKRINRFETRLNHWANLKQGDE